jgi:hypothetical protein
VLLGNNNGGGGNPRALSNGGLGNVEIWSGLVSAPEPVTMTMLGLGSLVGIMALRRRNR